MRGETYLMLRNYELALTGFNHAVDLMAKKDWCFYDRALAYLALDQLD